MVDTLLSELDYTVRADGKRTAVDEQVFDGTSTKATRVDWLYDNIGRLTQEDYDADGASLDFTADYLFDLVGNRLERSVDQGRGSTVDETTDYVYDANDRLLTETKDTAVDSPTVYTYDDTQQTAKTIHQGLTSAGAVVADTDYEYNRQGRMSRVELDADGNGTPETRLDYEYDASGIRVAQTKTVDGKADGDFDDPGDTSDRTEYLVDHRNPTGYAQVLEEHLNGTLSKSHTIGHDVMAEAIIAGAVRRLLKDGHGSTRQLVDALGNVITSATAQVFAYDAYGVPIGFDPAHAL